MSHRQLPMPLMEVETVDQRRSIAGPQEGPVVVPEGTTGLAVLIAAAEDVKCQKLHLSFGIKDPSYWTKVKNGTKPAPRIDELFSPPADVQRAMCTRWARMLGMTVTTDNRRAQAVAELIESAARVLKEIA